MRFSFSLPVIIVHMNPLLTTEPSEVNCANICLPVDSAVTSVNLPENVRMSVDVVVKPSYTFRRSQQLSVSKAEHERTTVCKEIQP